MSRNGSKQIRQMIADLDQQQITVYINRVCSNRFELHVNFEITGSYRQRRSCNKRITKLHQAHCLKSNAV